MFFLQNEVFNELQKYILPNEFNKYIKNLTINEKNSKPDFVVFNTTNEFIAKFIQTKYASKIEEIILEKTGIKPKILITSKKTISKKKKV